MKKPWINYIRSHDDIPWVFSDIDIQHTGADALSTKIFLDAFYSGEHPDSFASGLPFMRDKETQLARISGTLASLAGLERALLVNNSTGIDLSIQRILLLHSVFLSIGGIPLLYLGDEVGTLNDYSFRAAEAKRDDSRWVNRPAKSWVKDNQALKSRETPEAKIFERLRHMIGLRKNLHQLSGDTLEVLDTGKRSVLAYRRGQESDAVVVLANFSEFKTEINSHYLLIANIRGEYRELISNVNLDIKGCITLAPYQSLWLVKS